jgi:adenylate kinase family enzyme
VQRVSLVGNAGSGKTTLGRQLAAALAAPFLELDAVNHQQHWTPLPPAQLRARVADVVGRERWVVDGNYGGVRDLVWDRADTVVWFDFPRWLVMARVLRRTTGRVLTRRVLWNGNRERLRDVLSRDPERSIVAWAWTQHAGYRTSYRQALTGAGVPAGLTVVRLSRRSQVRALLRSATAAAAAAGTEGAGGQSPSGPIP